VANPDSAVTRFRRFLAAVIEPRPDPGEAWCLNCCLCGDHTLVITPDGVDAHAELHRQQMPDATVTIQATWPCR
jgi:hypothetical protein